MGPRTILYTGKGGVGKTSVAAATARRCAAAGMRTVWLNHGSRRGFAEVPDYEVRDLIDLHRMLKQ